jgi:hypothetical protein
MGTKEKMTENACCNDQPTEQQDMRSMMMDQFFGAMSSEQKQKMMERMMDQFMSTMSAEDKQKMMRAMMPKMMSNMMGNMMGEGSNPMMGMMSSMMGNMMAGKDSNGAASEMPWDMCKKMMSNMSRASELASYATPELHGLFEEWLSQVEEEMQADIQKQGSVHPDELAKKYKLSKESIHFILGKLAQKDQINLKAERK